MQASQLNLASLWSMPFKGGLRCTASIKHISTAQAVREMHQHTSTATKGCLKLKGCLMADALHTMNWVDGGGNMFSSFLDVHS